MRYTQESTQLLPTSEEGFPHAHWWIAMPIIAVVNHLQLTLECCPKLNKYAAWRF